VGVLERYLVIEMARLKALRIFVEVFRFLVIALWVVWGVSILRYIVILEPGFDVFPDLILFTFVNSFVTLMYQIFDFVIPQTKTREVIDE